MTFQFMCPKGCLLEGDESDMGETIDCPDCGITFVIPTVEDKPAATDVSAAPPRRRLADLEQMAAAENDAASALPQIMQGDAEGGEFAPFQPRQVDAGPRILHIPCPSCRHVLETPDDMLDIDALCPHCGQQFHLLYSESLEGQHEQQEKFAAIDRKEGKKWFTIAIVAGIVVALMLVIMIGMAVSS